MYVEVCGLLSRGVVAIFGPLARSTAMHVQSICDALEIPHIETRWDFQLERDDLSINLYPRPSILTRAFNELIKAWGWKTFAIVYEENEAVMRLQGFYKEAQQRGWKVTLYQFKSGSPFRDIFWKIKQNHERNIVLDVKPQHIHKVLKHVSDQLHSFIHFKPHLHSIFMKRSMKPFTFLSSPHGVCKHYTCLSSAVTLYCQNFHPSSLFLLIFIPPHLCPRLFD